MLSLSSVNPILFCFKLEFEELFYPFLCLFTQFAENLWRNFLWKLLQSTIWLFSMLFVLVVLVDIVILIIYPSFWFFISCSFNFKSIWLYLLIERWYIPSSKFLRFIFCFIELNWNIFEILMILTLFSWNITFFIFHFLGKFSHLL